MASVMDPAGVRLLRQLVFLIISCACLAGATGAHAAICDANDDGFVDIEDINAIVAARNTPASGPDDPRDADGDGTITLLDARQCVPQCTLPRCAPVILIDVPDVVGLTLEDATAAILTAGLTLGTVTTDFSNTVPAGRVITQAPTGGAQVLPGTAVDLVVSQGPDNTAPTIAITAPADGDVFDEGVPILFEGFADDAEDGDLSAGIEWDSSLDGPLGTGATISTALSDGSHVITASVTDAFGASVNDSISVTVLLTVTVPDITGLPQAAAKAEIIAAGLAVGAVTTASSSTVPAGSVIAQDPTAGAEVAPGTAVDLIVSTGAETDIDFLRPAVTVTATPDAANVGETVTVTVVATDDVGVVSRALRVDGVPVALDAAGTATFSSPTAGIFIAEAFADDAAGNTGFARDEIRFLVPGDTTPPTVAITSPASNSTLDFPVDVIGTAADDTVLTRYQIEISAAGTNQFVNVATSTTAVTNGVLGLVDTTRLRNGQFDLRLTAEDQSGNVASVTRTIAVARHAVVGNFRLDQTDLTIPTPGLRVDVTRAYDNRVKHPGDFGVGWNLAGTDIVVSESGVPGDGWQQVSSGGFLPTFSLQPTTAHRVTVTIGGERTDSFGVVLNPSSSVLIPFSFTIGTNASLTAEPGTFSELVSLANNSNLPVNPGGVGPVQLLGDLITFEPWDPDRYQLTDTDGTVYAINQNAGVERVTDSNGNTLTFTTGGIIHSAGASVAFTRDGQGRITEITDPLGNVHTYQYDFYGDLVRYTDAEGNATTYAYDFDHNLVGITDARGVRTLRNEYDDSGRVVAQVDAIGARTEHVHDIDSQTEVVNDRLGNTAVLQYDISGNVVEQTDPLGNVSRATFDARRNALTRTDALGNTHSFAYDAAGNRVSETDPLGNTTTWTYNAAGQVLATTDSNGVSTTYAYDARGNLLSTTDGLGNVTTYNYDGAGRPLSITDPLGNVTTVEYVAACREATRTVDPLGASATTTYNANCRPLTVDDANGNTTTFTYDRNDRMLARTFADGTATLFEYSPTGTLTGVTDASGNVTEHVYDLRDDLLRTIDPVGNTVEYTYDAQGNPVAVTSPAGRTAFAYDALRQLVAVTDPLGQTTSYTYDAVGNAVERTAPNGTQTRFTYDAVGRVLDVENGASASISSHAYTYDAVGNRVSVTENGRAETYIYDALHRIVEEARTDAAIGNDTVSYTYDAAGNRASKTDGAGAISYVYDAANHLLSAGTRSFTYDANGNTLTSTDGAATTTFAYDFRNRLSSAVASASTLTFEYDHAGNRTGLTVDGAATRYIVDTNRQLPAVLAEQDAAGATTAANTVGLNLVSQDRGGVLSLFYYDGVTRTRVLTAFGGTVTDAYTYDAFGNVLGATGTTENPHRLGGGLFDPATGLTAFGARNYDPTTGRYLSPVAGERNPFDPLSANRYLYLRSNPMNPGATTNLDAIDASGRTATGDETIAEVLRAAMLPH